jgi:hypothetical protein
MGWFTPMSGRAVSAVGAPAQTAPPFRPQGLLGWLRQALGGWPGPQQAQGTEAAAVLEREHLRGGPAHIKIPAFLPYYDDQSGVTTEMYLAFRRMFADPNIKAALLGKLLAVMSQELQIHPADKDDPASRRHAEFCRWNLAERLHGGIAELAWAILSGGCLDGYSVCEKVLVPQTRGKWAGKVVLRKLAAKDVQRDLVPQLDEFKNVVSLMGLRYNGGEEYDPSLFVIYSHLPFYSNPTGTSDLRAVYGRYWMLDTVLKLRAYGLEKRALPHLWGTYQHASQAPSLADALSKLKSQNWTMAPEGCKIEAVNIAGMADAQFAQAVNDLREEIFLGIQGATLQALVGGQGEERGNSQVHQDTASLFKWHLSNAICNVLNDQDSGLIKDLVDLNFVADEYPRATLSAVDPAELQAEIAVDQGLAQMGFPLSLQELAERYGRTIATDPRDQLQAPGQQPSGLPGGLPPIGDQQDDAAGEEDAAQPAPTPEPEDEEPAAEHADQDAVSILTVPPRKKLPEPEPAEALEDYAARLSRRHGPEAAAAVIRTAAALLHEPVARHSEMAQPPPMPPSPAPLPAPQPINVQVTVPPGSMVRRVVERDPQTGLVTAVVEQPQDGPS